MKKLTLGTQEVVVQELKVRHLRDIQKLLASPEISTMSMPEVLEKHIIPLCVQGVGCDDLTVSEAMQVWEAFKEVNKSFLKIMSAVLETSNGNALALRELFLS